MRGTGADHMYLDARHFGAEIWEQRFPTILAACRTHGIEPASPTSSRSPRRALRLRRRATDLAGRVDASPGSTRAGEAACTGVHGANRLASNSLLEGLVFAERIAADIADRGPHTGPRAPGRPGPRFPGRSGRTGQASAGSPCSPPRPGARSSGS